MCRKLHLQCVHHPMFNIPVVFLNSQNDKSQALARDNAFENLFASDDGWANDQSVVYYPSVVMSAEGGIEYSVIYF